MGGRRERKKQLLRERIWEETIRLIEREGVEGTTIDAVCQGVDVAKKTFYNYYGSKHVLLIDICQSQLLNRTALLIDEALAGSDRLDEQLDTIFAAFAQRNRSAGKLDRELIDYMVGSLSDNRSDGGGQLTFMNKCFLRLYQAAEAQIKPELTPTFCAEMTVGMSNAITLNWLHDKTYDTGYNFLMLLDYIKNSMLRGERP
ncbi:MAG: TetR/AcrR family transcriptional regulator [Proteobacteria bacterium]|nr:TetR/AcrR family transcriptional regulator [Pseudomonadota bacterium]